MTARPPADDAARSEPTSPGRVFNSQERSSRRLVKNAIIWAVCSLVLLILLWVLLMAGPL